jgi:hypothetical protein
LVGVLAKFKHYNSIPYDDWTPELALMAIKDGDIWNIPKELLKNARVAKAADAVTSKMADNEEYHAIKDRLWTPALALRAANEGQISAIPDRLWTQEIADIAEQWNFHITKSQYDKLPKQ